MANTQNAAMDAIQNATGKAGRQARRDAALAADSRQQRAAHAAGQDRRSIGVTRKAWGR